MGPGPDEHGFGSPCDTGEDCYSGLCAEHMGDTVCTETCSDTCPPGWSCEQVNVSGGDASYICVSSFEHLCRPCLSGTDCTSETSETACIDYDGQGAFCGAVCELDGDCPDGFVCQDSLSTRGGTTRQCVDADGICECSALAISLGLMTSCTVTNGSGSCDGVRVCDADGLAACDAPTPTEEVCNGIDDDCDGATDDVSCDDQNPCTEDLCAGEAGCDHSIMADAPCDDGDPGTASDTCSPEGTCGGAAITCPTGACIAESLPNGVDCDITHLAAGATCDDGDTTTKDDQCDGGDACAGTPYTCEAGPCEVSSSPNGVDCTAEYAAVGESCDDMDPATSEDLCDGAGGCLGTPFTCTPSQCDATSEPDGSGCVTSPKTAGSGCDDGDVSTKGDTCDGLGACLGQPYICEQSGCIESAAPNGADCDIVFAPEGLSCDDANPDTKTDACDGAGTCVGETYGCEPSQCEAASTPNGDGCDLVFKVDGFACDDSDPATADDACDGQGGCAGTPYTCDLLQCADTVSPNGVDCDITWSPAGVGCDDGDDTTKVDACDGQGGCMGMPYPCEATQCEAASVHDGVGCDITFKIEGLLCDDGDAATLDDQCDGAGGCGGSAYGCAPGTCELSATPNGTGCDVIYAALSAACDDGLDTTMGDQCDGQGGCAGTPYECIPDQCDVSSVTNGLDCDVEHLAVGTPCDDGDANTKGDQCDGGGACVGEPYGCVPSQCEAESVVDGAGCNVTFMADGVGCDDGDVNTQSDQCDGAGGCTGTPYTCEPTQCETQSVPDGVGCVIQNTPAAVACDDQDPATKVDICDGFGACGGTPYSCEASQCDAAQTPNGVGCDILPKAQGVGCDDGDLQTQGDVCDGASGCAGTPYSCAPGLCEVSSTPDGVGCDITYAQAETPCDDQDLTTQGDSCDGAGGCSGSPYACAPTQCDASSVPNGVDCDVVFQDTGAGCDDQEPATKDDQCDGNGGCVGIPYTCTPGVCEAASIADGVGCAVSYDPQGTSCDDLNPETKGDVCSGLGSCAGQAYSCEVGLCELAAVPNGEGCDITYAEATAACDDDNPNTKGDQCDGSGGCIGTPYTCGPSQCDASSTPDGVGCAVSFKAQGVGCDDGDPTTTGDQCDGNGGCSGDVYTCTPTQCQVTSEPDGVGCAVTYAGNGVGCNDGDLTTKTDVCDGAGGCSGESYACVPATCEASAVHNGADCDVVFQAPGIECNDQDLTTLSDQCNGSGGCAGTPYTCTTSQCEASATHNGVDCDVTFHANTVACDDDDATTQSDLCDGAGGCAGQTYSCSPTQCEASSTPNGVDCTVTFHPPNITCDDGQLTTKGDQCDGAGGCAGQTYSCSPTQCEASSTPNGVDCTVAFHTPSITCDDGDAATVDDRCDGAGGCAGDATVCGDNITEGLEACDVGPAPSNSCVYGQQSCTVCIGCQETAGQVVGYCGDGAVQPAHEECDFGDTVNGDGCSSTCQAEVLTVGGTSSQWGASGHYRGNLYQWQETRTLKAFDAYLTFSSACNISLYVHEKVGGAKVVRWSTNFTQNGSDGFISSGPIGLGLEAGRQYELGVGWTCSAKYYGDYNSCDDYGPMQGIVSWWDNSYPGYSISYVPPKQGSGCGIVYQQTLYFD
jgi:cysteine-rich repeat protein